MQSFKLSQQIRTSTTQKTEMRATVSATGGGIEVSVDDEPTTDSGGSSAEPDCSAQRTVDVAVTVTTSDGGPMNAVLDIVKSIKV